MILVEKSHAFLSDWPTHIVYHARSMQLPTWTFANCIIQMEHTLLQQSGLDLVSYRNHGHGVGHARVEAYIQCVWDYLLAL